MTRTERKRWHEYFRHNLKEGIKQLEWVLEATEMNDKVLANRIGCTYSSIRTYVLFYVMPSGLKNALLKKYPNRMVAQ